MNRLEAKFAKLRKENRAAFAPFISAGDPDAETSFAILSKLPGIGADMIELGMPFTDPMADGVAVQAAGQRALAAGATMAKTLEMVRKFRKADKTTPITLMGYYNPIHAYGTARFARDMAEAGADGLIAVDVPPEEDEVLRIPLAAQGISMVRFVTPTTDDERLKLIVDGASGYLYYVSFTGVTGSKVVQRDAVKASVDRIRKATSLPVVVGFGISTPEQAAEIGSFADGAAVGSAIVSRIEKAVNAGQDKAALTDEVLNFCQSLAKSLHNARVGNVVG